MLEYEQEVIAALKRQGEYNTKWDEDEIAIIESYFKGGVSPSTAAHDIIYLRNALN